MTCAAAGLGPRASSAWERIYADYLAGNRLEEYRRLLECITRARLLPLDTCGPQCRHCGQLHFAYVKVFVHRHDIDTDVGGARAFFEIEKALGIRASYYFRLSTIDRDLMREINSYGSEVGYH